MNPVSCAEWHVIDLRQAPTWTALMYNLERVMSFLGKMHSALGTLNILFSTISIHIITKCAANLKYWMQKWFRLPQLPLLYIFK